MIDQARLLGLVESMRVSQITVSHSFDTYRGGAKKSHFSSMNFSVPEGATLEEVAVLHLYGSKVVTESCIRSALAQGAITVNEANELIEGTRLVHELLIEKKLGARQENG